ncbi:MAG: hypothetical protein NT067_02760, partial [Candidatus Diapherotrites archaeon]|nr:hypothetical protein [Candidatus Diapherotrites archaeon]
LQAVPEKKQDALLTLGSDSLESLQEVIQMVKDCNGTVKHVFPPNALIVEIPASEEEKLLASGKISGIFSGKTPLSAEGKKGKKQKILRDIILKAKAGEAKERLPRRWQFREKTKAVDQAAPGKERPAREASLDSGTKRPEKEASLDSDVEELIVPKMQRKEKPVEKEAPAAEPIKQGWPVFYFWYSDKTSASLAEFKDAIKTVGEDSLNHHAKNSDFSKYLGKAYDKKVAAKIAEIEANSQGKELRKKLLDAL